MAAPAAGAAGTRLAAAAARRRAAWRPAGITGALPAACLQAAGWQNPRCHTPCTACLPQASRVQRFSTVSSTPSACRQSPSLPRRLRLCSGPRSFVPSPRGLHLHGSSSNVHLCSCVSYLSPASLCSGPRSFPMLAVVRLEHIKHALLLGAVDTGGCLEPSMRACFHSQTSGALRGWR